MLASIPAMNKMMIRRAEATTKSKKFAITAARGNTSLGKYTLVTKSILWMRLFVAKRIDATKNAHGTDFTETEVNCAKSTGFPDTIEKAFLTRIPAATIIIGMKMAQRNPITDCLYLIFISLQVSI
jgi:hypothetical protein